MMTGLLDDLPDWKAGAELSNSLCASRAVTDDDGADLPAAVAGLLRTVLVVGQPTAVDLSRAPDGKHVLWVQVRMLPLSRDLRRVRRDRARLLGRCQ